MDVNSQDAATPWAGIGAPGLDDDPGTAMEACRQYLLMVADRTIEPSLKAKGGASDIVQDTFLEAQRDIEQFRGETREELRAWLKRILLNNVSNFARQFRESGKRRIDKEVRLDAGEATISLVGREPSPSRHAIRNEQATALSRAIVRLPEGPQRVISWRHRDHLSFEEIGRLLGVSPEAARKQWARAVERLQAELAEGPGPEAER